MYCGWKGLLNASLDGGADSFKELRGLSLSGKEIDHASCLVVWRIRMENNLKEREMLEKGLPKAEKRKDSCPNSEIEAGSMSKMVSRKGWVVPRQLSDNRCQQDIMRIWRY